MKPRSILIFLLGVTCTGFVIGVVLTISPLWIPTGIAGLLLLAVID